MQNQVPHFNYRFANISNKHVACIEIGKRVIHEIRNLDEFYKMFGYTQEIGKAGVLPDEFIWSEYKQDSATDFCACFQIHIIEYLKKYSDTFQKEFGDQFESWIDAHVELSEERGISCVACRLRPS